MHDNFAKVSNKFTPSSKIRKTFMIFNVEMHSSGRAFKVFLNVHAFCPQKQKIRKTSNFTLNNFNSDSMCGERNVRLPFWGCVNLQIGPISFSITLDYPVKA